MLWLGNNDKKKILNIFSADEDFSPVFFYPSLFESMDREHTDIEN